jgi:hypothetical protein
LAIGDPPGESLPERRALWLWAWERARPYVGWALLALGALSILLGWYGVSGQSVTAKQLPYLVSGGLTGVALIVIGAVFLATDDVRRQVGRLHEIERKVDDLYSLLVVETEGVEPTAAEPVSAPPATAPKPDGVVALPNGSSYHRPDCTLVAGKPTVEPVDKTAIKARSLKPCRICDPPPPAKIR